MSGGGCQHTLSADMVQGKPDGVGELQERSQNGDTVLCEYEPDGHEWNVQHVLCVRQLVIKLSNVIHHASYRGMFSINKYSERNSMAMVVSHDQRDGWSQECY